MTVARSAPADSTTNRRPGRKIDRECPRCGVGPGWRCRKKFSTTPIKGFHPER